jgi:cytochrome c biogenesis protein CcdA
MEYLQSILNSSSFPVLTAFLLGVFTSIHPCPLALNITAIGYVSHDVKDKKAILYKGLIYTIGRITAYTLITLIIYFGTDALKIGSLFNFYGRLFIGPFLVIMGILMLDFIPLKLPVSDKISSFLSKKMSGKNYSSFLLGFVFSFVFCPHTIVLYFGMLIPLVMATHGGLTLPVVYAVGTGLPVILVSFILACSIDGINKFFNNMKVIEKWLRIITAIIFIFVGIYFIVDLFVNHTQQHCSY